MTASRFKPSGQAALVSWARIDRVGCLLMKFLTQSSLAPAPFLNHFLKLCGMLSVSDISVLACPQILHFALSELLKVTEDVKHQITHFIWFRFGPCSLDDLQVIEWGFVSLFSGVWHRSVSMLWPRSDCDFDTCSHLNNDVITLSRRIAAIVQEGRIFTVHSSRFQKGGCC